MVRKEDIFGLAEYSQHMDAASLGTRAECHTIPRCVNQLLIVLYVLVTATEDRLNGSRNLTNVDVLFIMLGDVCMELNAHGATTHLKLQLQQT